MINHFTSQSKACKLLKIFSFLNIERKLWKIVAFSRTNNHPYIIYPSIMDMVNYFHGMTLKKINVAAWFLVLPTDIENLWWFSRGLYISRCLYIYIYRVLGIIYSRSLPLFIEIYRVCDNRRTVNTSTSPHISDQLGTENVWETLLCWFIVMIWVLFCKNMYRYERNFGSFHWYSSLLMFPIAQSNLPKLAVGAAKTS